MVVKNINYDKFYKNYTNSFIPLFFLFIIGHIFQIFNLKRDDFGTLREYNDYLERIEIFVFNLVDGINVTETEAEINRFKNENASLIDRNRYKVSFYSQFFPNLII